MEKPDLESIKNAKKIMEDLKKIKEEEGRKELAIRYETDMMEEIGPLIAEFVDDGSEKSLDYYLGAEKITRNLMAHLPSIGVPTTSQAYERWAEALAYISHKIISFQEQKLE